jgi:hypothetical protein
MTGNASRLSNVTLQGQLYSSLQGSSLPVPTFYIHQASIFECRANKIKKLQTELMLQMFKSSPSIVARRLVQETV